jgi:hypothetical protein
MPIKTSSFSSDAKANVRVVTNTTYSAGLPAEYLNVVAPHIESQTFGNWRIGNSNPDWKQQIRNHVEATTVASGRKWDHVHKTPANCRVEVINQSTVSPFYKRTVAVSTLSGIVPGLYPNNNATSQNVRDDVHARHVAKAMSKIDAIRGSLASGEDMGELRQTIRMLASPFKALRGHMTDYIDTLAKFKRARAMKPRAFMKAVTDTYLEYNFGVKPLVSTISHVVTEISRQGSRMSYVPFQVTTTKEWGGSTGTQEVILPSSNCKITYGIHTLNEYSERWQGEVSAGGDPSGRLSSVQILGLTPDKWLPTLYNLIPYSFVLDYVANVGDIVSATTFRSADISWCCVTRRRKTSTRYSSKSVVKTVDDGDSPWGYTRTSGGGYGGQQFFECTEFDRDRLRSSDFLIPLVVKIPEIWEKPWLNVAALMNSSFRVRNQSF